MPVAVEAVGGSSSSHSRASLAIPAPAGALACRSRETARHFGRRSRSNLPALRRALAPPEVAPSNVSSLVEHSTSSASATEARSIRPALAEQPATIGSGCLAAALAPVTCADSPAASDKTSPEQQPAAGTSAAR